jgi:hypothetical protein
MEIILLIILLILLSFFSIKENFIISSSSLILSKNDPMNLLKNTSFSDQIAKVQNGTYLWENNKQWFIDILEKNKNKTIKSTVLLNEENIDSRNIGEYLVKDIFKNQFDIIKSRTIKANSSIWDNGLCYIVYSNHVIHRENKMYGIEIELYTLQDKKTNKIYLIDYNFLGFIMEDQLDKEKKYNDNYVCDYLKNIKMDRGITPSNEGDLKCFNNK